MTPFVLVPLLPGGSHAGSVLDVRSDREMVERASGTVTGGLLVVTSRRPLPPARCNAAGWAVDFALFVDDAASPSVAVRSADAGAAARLIGELTVPAGPRQLARWWWRRLVRPLAPRRALAFAVVLRRV